MGFFAFRRSCFRTVTARGSLHRLPAVEADTSKTKTIHYMKKFLTLLAVVFGAVALHAGEYPDISITELKSAIAEKKVTLIDANGDPGHRGRAGIARCTPAGQEHEQAKASQQPEPAPR